MRLVRTALLLAAACAPAAVVDQPSSTPSMLGIETVSSDQFESHPAFDPRTGDIYFVRSSPQFQGWKVWRSRCTATRWDTAEPAPFSGPGVEADPFFTADGRQLYFISTRPDPPAKTGDDLDIWRVSRDRAGRWGAPERLPAPVNSGGAEWFPRLAADGRLYLGSDRPGGRGHTDIYAARRTASGWQVENVGGEVSTAGDEYEFEPSRDGRFAVLMADGSLFRIERAGESWGRRTPLATGQAGFHVGPLLSPSGRSLLYAHGAPGHSGELFRLALTRMPEDWPPRCPRR